MESVHIARVNLCCDLTLELFKYIPLHLFQLLVCGKPSTYNKMAILHFIK